MPSCSLCATHGSFCVSELLFNLLNSMHSTDSAKARLFSDNFYFGVFAQMPLKLHNKMSPFLDFFFFFWCSIDSQWIPPYVPLIICDYGDVEKERSGL